MEPRYLRAVAVHPKATTQISTDLGHVHHFAVYDSHPFPHPHKCLIEATHISTVDRRRILPRCTLLVYHYYRLMVVHIKTYTEKAFRHQISRINPVWSTRQSAAVILYVRLSSFSLSNSCFIQECICLTTLVSLVFINCSSRLTIFSTFIIKLTQQDTRWT